MDGASDPSATLLTLGTSNPYDLIPRVLDFARKVSIDLERLEADMQEDGFYEVRFCFCPCDPQDMMTLANRVALIQSGLDHR